MRGLRVLAVISIPIVVVLGGLLVGLWITGTGDRADKDNLGLPVYASPTATHAATPD